MFYLKQNPLVIRKISGLKKREVFLTFDDGPDPDTTIEVLNLLKEENWPATFFVIGQKAQQNQDIIKRMQQEGHAVFSHSLDHHYLHYFKGQLHLKNWIQSSLQDLSEITKSSQKVFRPPVGILTPPLVAAAEEMQVPLILWNHRFFDTVHSLSDKKILKNLSQISTGDIVLLHDRQKKSQKPLFLSSLGKYIRALKSDSWVGMPLSNELIFQAAGLS